jgi:ubiquinone/menaquinone biosynthesis C-methylase UbiE
LPLREDWDANAQGWIEWARSPAHSHPYWRFHRPRFLELLPPPGKLTVEIGCGEGRLLRELRQIGHRVIGVDGSLALARAAVAADSEVPVLVGDASALPLASEIADLAVTLMALQNVEDLPGACREAARVLVSGGQFCIGIPHPLKFLIDQGVGRTSYFQAQRYDRVTQRQGLRVTLPSGYRPLEAYFQALEAAHLGVESVREPVPTQDHVRDNPQMARCLQIPCLLLIRARKS